MSFLFESQEVYQKVVALAVEFAELMEFFPRGCSVLKNLSEN